MCFAELALATVILGPTLWRFDLRCFQNCDLRSLVIPRSVRVLGESAFRNATIESITFEQGSELAEIESECFAGCSLKAISIPQLVKKLPEGCFKYATIEAIEFEFGSRLKEIAELCFSRCYAGSLSVPPSVETIGRLCFNRAEIGSLNFSTESQLKPPTRDCVHLSCFHLIRNPPSDWNFVSSVTFVDHFEDDMIRRRRSTQLRFAGREARTFQSRFDRKECDALRLLPHAAELGPRKAPPGDQLAAELVAPILRQGHPALSQQESVSLIQRFFPERLRQFFPKESEMFGGIIDYLTAECGGNVHDRNVVAMTYSGPYSGNPDGPEKVCDLHDNTYSYCWEDNGGTSWLCFDFMDRRIIPTDYAITSFGMGPSGPHCKSWVILLSDNGTTWKEIDRREGNNDLNDMRVTCRFALRESPVGRFFKLANTARNHQGNWHLVLNAFEIFGWLIE